MTIDEFEYKYREKGGFKHLYEMRFLKHTSMRTIGRHFGISRTMVAAYIKDIFGKIDDVRGLRREKRVEMILDYMKSHSPYETDQAFKFENPEHIAEANFLANKQGIYPRKEDTLENYQT